MNSETDIFFVDRTTSLFHEQLELLHEREHLTPSSVQYKIRRFRKPVEVNIDDRAEMVYTYKAVNPTENTLELRYCVTGNTYCHSKHAECNLCRGGDSKICSENIESADLISFKFTPSHLSQFVKGIKTNSYSENILNFSHTASFSRSMPLCSRTKMIINSLLNHNYTDSLENIFINAQTQMLLLYSMDCMTGEKEESFSCKFLANEADREKIHKAREILLQHISEPLTIKALSRKVAINECYLKKGFKEMFGTTIFDFFQSQRMEHAKFLLYEKGLSVTDVSALLGYSSISHFSTAFKKHTGLKPCELLFH